MLATHVMASNKGRGETERDGHNLRSGLLLNLSVVPQKVIEKFPPQSCPVSLYPVIGLFPKVKDSKCLIRNMRGKV